MVLREQLEIATRGRGTCRIDPRIDALIDGRVGDGICHLFCLHTSASLLLTENADPQVLRDLEAWMARMVPDGSPLFGHDAEGPDDMPAHLRTVLTGSSLTLPLADGRLCLGTWQGVFLWEHRTAPQHRRVLITCIGQ